MTRYILLYNTYKIFNQQYQIIKMISKATNPAK